MGEFSSESGTSTPSSITEAGMVSSEFAIEVRRGPGFEVRGSEAVDAFEIEGVELEVKLAS